MAKRLTLAGKTFSSRLLIGTGKYANHALMREALKESGAEIITVALRRIDFNHPEGDILTYIDTEEYLLLPNTAGAKDSQQAVRLARLARAAGGVSWIKLEVTPEPRYLLPDPVETLKAAEILVKEGFTVLPYINADPILAKRLEEAGTAAVMPLGAPIGTNLGIRTKEMIAIIIEQANIPVIVDAGLGAPSHAAEAMEMGADAVLVNTAIAVAENPVMMARAFRLAVEAGFTAKIAGLAGKQVTASPSSPIKGLIDTFKSE